MSTSKKQPNLKLRRAIPVLALLLLCGLTVIVGSALSADASTSGDVRGQTGGFRYAPLPSPTAVRDAFLLLAPQAGGPPNGGSVSVGSTFTLDLILNAGSNNAPNGVTAQQSYLTFTYPLLGVIDPDGTCPNGIPISTTVSPDTTMFEAVLQNEICNGPAQCTFLGVTADPGSFAYASGALSNCPEGCGGAFRVAIVNMCAIAPGTAVLHWLFSPPAPPIRDTEIVTVDGSLVQDPALFTDYTIHVLGEGTPSPTPPPTGTPTATSTHTPASTSTPTRTPIGSVTPCPMNFSDVHPTDYFYDAVLYLYCDGVISGYSDGTFRPYNNTTRAQLSKIVVLAEGWPINIDNGPHFSDVPPSDPFYFYVETAYHQGIISGYSDGTFRPGNPVTRAQLCKIIVLAQGWADNCTPPGHFSDVPPGDPFFCYIETAYSHNIISGYSDGTFRPGSSATRGQICKIVYNALLNP